MRTFLDHPFIVLAVSFVLLWLASLVGYRLGVRMRNPGESTGDDFKFVLGGTLTLLGLIIGFTFSMAVSRYDLRKNYEEQEANAIGTAYVRADLLPVADVVKARGLLTNYLRQRIRYYESRDSRELQQLNAETVRLQNQMWSIASGAGNIEPNPVEALAVASMNDVLNSQGYTQAAWWNRIPAEAWLLLTLIAVLCNVLVGYGAERKSAFLFLILPIALSIALSLIADIDSPRGGFIRVKPQNLESLDESLRAQ